MDTVLKIKSHSLSDELVRDLKSQIGQAAHVEIHIHDAPDSAEWLDEDRFWDIIGQLNWAKQGDDEAVVEPVVAALSQMPVPCIVQFENILAEKLWLLDTETHANAFLADDPNKRLSVDLFLYARCCVVANGRGRYEQVLHDPSAWPLGLTFSVLLRVASLAYQRKTGKPFEHFPAFNYETYSNEQGWA